MEQLAHIQELLPWCTTSHDPNQSLSWFYWLHVLLFVWVFTPGKKGFSVKKGYLSILFRRLTIWGHEDYLRQNFPLSPWVAVPGWKLETCFRDPMHSLFLGTCKDLHASTLAYWVRKNVLGLDGSLSDQLREISVMLKEDCLGAGNLCLFRLLKFRVCFKFWEVQIKHILLWVLLRTRHQTKDPCDFQNLHTCKYRTGAAERIPWVGLSIQSCIH